MDYTINPTAFTSALRYPVQWWISIKLAGAAQLKVLLWIMRNMGDGICINIQAISLPRWMLRHCNTGSKPVLLPPGKTQKPQPGEKTAKQLYIRQQLNPARRGGQKRARVSRNCLLLQEAQLKFGRGLRQNEASTLVWLYDDEGLSAALILMIIEYAKSENKCNIGFIERTAIDWINSGIDSISAAEKKIRELNDQKIAWNIVRSAMGIEDRRPSPNELKLAYKWVVEYGFSREIHNRGI